MKQVLKITNIIAVAGILIMAFFVPLISFNGGSFSMSFLNTFSWISETPGLIGFYAVSVLVPAVIVFLTVLIGYMFSMKCAYSLWSSLISGLSFCAALILYCALLIPYLEDIDFYGETSVSPLYVINLLLYAVSTACSVIQYVILKKEEGDNTSVNNVVYPQQPMQQYSQQPSQQPMQEYPQQPSQQPMQEYSQQPMQEYSQQPPQELSQQTLQQFSQQLSQQPSIQPELQREDSTAEPLYESSVPVIRCISGDYEGAEFPCDTTITIGSDPQLANVVIAGEKISGVHCSISFSAENDSYLVVDGSLYGVIAEPPGTRLPAHIAVSLPRGTVVSIGSDTDRFMLV